MIKRFFKSVGYAINGVKIGIMEERNVRVDIVAMLYVFFFTKFYDFNKTQIVIIILMCFIVPALELMNTAVERAVDEPDKRHYMTAGHAKDAAAGGVLVAAVGIAIAGVVLFWDKQALFSIISYFTGDNYLIKISLFLLSLIISYLFITYDKFTNKKGK